jgi:WD40 repeat protein
MATNPQQIGSTLFVYHGHTLRVLAVAWSPDSKLIASGSGNNVPGANNTVRVWQAE